MSESTSSRTSEAPTPAPQPAEELSRLWQQGQQPDVQAFLARAGTLHPPQLAAVLLVDQRRRWDRGERGGAEVYLQAYPSLRQDPEAALDLIYGGYLLRCECGETPALSDFDLRFPEH